MTASHSSATEPRVHKYTRLLKCILGGRACGNLTTMSREYLIQTSALQCAGGGSPAILTF